MKTETKKYVGKKVTKLKVGLIVDDGDQSYTNYDLYCRSLSSDKYSIEYLFIQKKSPVKEEGVFKRVTNYLQKKGIKRFIDRISFILISKIEAKIALRNSKLKYVFQKHNLTKFDVPRIEVEPAVSPSGLVYRYKPEDIQAIQKLGLDVLIFGGSGILRGDILDVCRLGILSFHHGNNDVNRGGPPAFWEVFNREPATGFMIQRLQSELDGGDVIFKGSIPTAFLYRTNACRLYAKSSIFLHLTIEKISASPENIKVYPKAPYAYKLYVSPTFGEVFSYVMKTFFLGLKKLMGRLFNKTYRWGVAYQFSKDWKSAVLWRSTIIKNPPNRFLADPFVITENGQTVLFVEDYDCKTSRGKITAYELNGPEHKELGVVLEENFHLSYPFLFRADDGLYMIPETHESKDIRLYKCLEFPLKWTLEKILFQGLSAADTSVFKRDDKWWLLTNKDSSGIGEHGSELHVYYADSYDASDWTPHPMNPVIFDATCARNGGLILSDDGIYRVFQKQTFNMYGGAMGISKITEITPTSYSEEVLYDIPPKFMKNIKGTHTYSFDSGVLAFDFLKYESSRS